MICFKGSDAMRGPYGIEGISHAVDLLDGFNLKITRNAMPFDNLIRNPQQSIESVPSRRLMLQKMLSGFAAMSVPHAGAFVADRAVAAPVSNLSEQHLIEGVAATEIHLVASVDLSGPVAAQCQVGFAGARIYFEELNASGGIHGRRISLELEDDGFNPSRTKENIRRVEDTKSALAIFGVVGDAQASAAIPICERARLPLFAPISGDPALRGSDSRYTYFLRCSYEAEAQRLLQHAATLGHRKLAVAFQNDGFGESMRDILETLRVDSVRVHKSFGLDGHGESVKGRLTALGSEGVTGICVAAVGSAFTDFVRACRASTSSAFQIYGFSLVSPQDIYKELGQMGRGVVLAQCVPALSRISIPVVSEYRSLHVKAALDFPANAFTFEGFLMAKVFSEAIRRAGRGLNRATLLAALDTMGTFDVGGVRLSSGPASKSGSSYADIAVIDASGRLRY